MDKNFSWKNYWIFSIIVVVVTTIINWKIGVGFAIGTIAYFLKDKLLSKRFPHLDSNLQAFSSLAFYMFMQGVIIAATAIACWFIGKFPCFIAGFAGLILPINYFIVKGMIKK